MSESSHELFRRWNGPDREQLKPRPGSLLAQAQEMHQNSTDPEPGSVRAYFAEMHRNPRQNVFVEALAEWQERQDERERIFAEIEANPFAEPPVLVQRRPRGLSHFFHHE